MRLKAHALVNEFVLENAPREINIPGNIKDAMLERLKVRYFEGNMSSFSNTSFSFSLLIKFPSIDMFDEAQDHIFSLMDRDARINFKNSQVGHEMTRRLSHCSISSNLNTVLRPIPDIVLKVEPLEPEEESFASPKKKLGFSRKVMSARKGSRPSIGNKDEGSGSGESSPGSKRGMLKALGVSSPAILSESKEPSVKSAPSSPSAALALERMKSTELQLDNKGVYSLKEALSRSPREGSKGLPLLEKQESELISPRDILSKEQPPSRPQSIVLEEEDIDLTPSPSAMPEMVSPKKRMTPRTKLKSLQASGGKTKKRAPRKRGSRVSHIVQESTSPVDNASDEPGEMRITVTKEVVEEKVQVTAPAAVPGRLLEEKRRANSLFRMSRIVKDVSMLADYNEGESEEDLAIGGPLTASSSQLEQIEPRTNADTK